MSANLLKELGYDDPVGVGAVQGEVVEFNGQSIVIVGPFTPGDALQLRPGRRCVVLTEDAVGGFDISAIACPSCDDLTEERDDLERSLDDTARERDDMERELDDLEAELVAARSDNDKAHTRIETLERALAAAVHAGT